MDKNQLVNDLISITSRLAALMGAEVEKLRAHDIKGVEALQGDKAGLARAYETLMRELSRHPDILKDVAPALRAELAGKAEVFHRMLAENEAALRAAKEVNGRVLKAIADAVTESRKENATYSRSGAAAPGLTGRSAPPASMTINRTL
jgi:hypothetical protein